MQLSTRSPSFATAWRIRTAAGEYTIALAVFKNPQDTRIMPAFNLAMWAVYDFVIMAYPMFVMDIVIAALSVINFVQYRHKRRRKKHKH